MTVRQVIHKSDFIGLSTDSKPTAPTAGSGTKGYGGLGYGSTFHELDTGVKLIWDGEVWNEDLSGARSILIADNREN